MFPISYSNEKPSSYTTLNLFYVSFSHFVARYVIYLVWGRRMERGKEEGRRGGGKEEGSRKGRARVRWEGRMERRAKKGMKNAR